MSQLQPEVAAAEETVHHNSNQHHTNTNGNINNNPSNLSCSNVNGNLSSSSLASLVPGGVVTTQNISTVIKPKENNNSMQFVKITPPDLSKKAVEQIRVAQESKITKDKLKEVEEEWQSNLLKWKSKRRQHFVGPSGNKDDEGEQNNNIENGSGRKVKTFAEMIEQRARAGNRLNFNLQRYIGSGDEEEPPEHERRDGDERHQQDKLHEETNDRGDVVDFNNDISGHEETLVVRDNHHNLYKPNEKIESNDKLLPQSQTNNQIKGEPQPPQRLARTLQAKSEAAPRQPELKPLPRAPSSPKPHLEMLKQKFESLNQQHQTPPLQRPVLSFHRQQQQPPLVQSNHSQGQQFSQPAQSKQILQHQEPPSPPPPPPSKSLPTLSSNEIQQQKQPLPQPSPPKQQQQQQNVRLSELPVPQQAQLPPQSPPQLQKKQQQQSPHQRPQPTPPQQQLADVSIRKSSMTDVQQLSGSTPQQYSRSELRQRHETSPPMQHQKYQAPMPPQHFPPTRIPSEISSPPQSHMATKQRTKLPPPSPPRSQRIPQSTPPLPSPASTTSTESAPQPQLHSQQHIRNNNHNHKNKLLDHQSQQNDADKDPVLSVSGKRRCSSCREELGRGAAAFVVESLNLVYHTNCFKCSVCHVDLSNGFRGVDVRVHAGALHCQNCYSKDGLNYSRV